MCPFPTIAGEKFSAWERIALPNVQVQLVAEVQATDMTTLLNFDTSNNNSQHLGLAVWNL